VVDGHPKRPQVRLADICVGLGVDGIGPGLGDTRA